ncbi:MAG TPA: hypothetical protein GXZ21_13195 [Clostridiales bacterium]|nr:hypothetical protein [Clostridiales bacterium]
MGQMILVMGIALAIVLPIVIYIIHVIDRKDKAKNNIGASLAIKGSKDSILIKLYSFAKGFPLTKSYIYKIKIRYEMLYPGDPKEIGKKTMETALITWFTCIVSIVLLIVNKLNFNNLSVGIILVYVINQEIIGFMIKSTEIRLLEEMVVFISNIRHNYYINRMVDDGILLSLDGLSYEMRVHANKIYEIVTSNNLKEDVINYNATSHNKYLKMLLSLCTGVLEFTDKKVNGQYLFAANLENLKKEINIEILKQKKLRYLFSGVTFVTIAVIVPIDGIKKFGVSMMPELDDFYSGRAGLIYVVVTLITALVVYVLNNHLKGSKQTYPKDYRYLRKLEKNKYISRALENYWEKHYPKMEHLRETLKKIGQTISPKQLLLQRMMVSVFTFTISIAFIMFIHENNKKNITEKVTNISTLTTVTNLNQQEMMKEAILDQVKILKREEGVTTEQVFNNLVNSNVFYNSKINELIAEEVVNRVKEYQNEYFKWYELIISFSISFISFYIPYWIILFKKKILLMNMEDEVNQFNSIIYMMMFIDHITVIDILEELELFSQVFKQSIQECINDYNSGELEALTALKEKEGYLPFKGIIDNLIRCDAMSIDKAFDEISSDRESYHDRRKQDNEISVQKRADIAKPLSWIPTVLVMIYLTLPLLMASLKELQEFSKAIQNI